MLKVPLRRRFPVLIAMLLVAGGAVIGVLAFGAHAGPYPAPAVDTNPVRNVPDIPPYDFDANPLGDVPGTMIAAVTPTALRSLGAMFPVQVVLPTTANADPDIFVTDSSVQADWQLVVLNYKSSAYGQVQIFERAQGLTQAAIDEWAEPGYCTSCAFDESIVLAGGQRATVLGTPETTTVVHWIQNGVQIDVMGPYSSLSRDDAIKVANDLSVQ
jgi:hypothetical protein